MTGERAPHAPWRRPTWSTARKDCVGTALGNSRLWFTTGSGIITEIFYPHVDIPQIRDLGFIIADGQGLWQELKMSPAPTIEWPDPRVPAPTIRHHHEHFEFCFRVVVDPIRDALLIDYALQGNMHLRPYLLCAPRLGADAANNRAFVGHWAGRAVLWAEQGPFGLAITCKDGAGRPALGPCSVGEVGISDLWQDFHAHGQMTWRYAEAGPGEVALGGCLPRTGTIAVGLASCKEAAATIAWSALSEGFERAARDYASGWQDWHSRHEPKDQGAHGLPEPLNALYTRSATVIKVHEDRGFPGAIVASLAVPWGEASDTIGGYHLVWSRDLVESAGALLALGAMREVRTILTYLMATQQDDGHWLQNQWLGGLPFWRGVQLDETGFPVLLAAALKARGALHDIAVEDMVVRALRFLVREGPVTTQDRWEEDAGINAFTLAVVIAALVEGAAFLSGKTRDCALMFADYWNTRIEDWTYVEDTALARQYQVPGYYIRAAPADILNRKNADGDLLPIKNRNDDLQLAAASQIATDFLQLVRFGLRDPHDPRIVATIVLADALLKTTTPAGPVWHRYNGDGYGEHADGSPFNGAGIGRGWPLLTGERGHYAIAAGEDPLPYLMAMAGMTGRGGLLPEQVWDSDPLPAAGLSAGAPSGSAMPLAWAHAEFIKLCHSHRSGHPVDRPTETWRRYAGQRPRLTFRLWQWGDRPREILAGEELRVALDRDFVIHWGLDGWHGIRDTPAEDWGLRWVASLPSDLFKNAHTLNFTLYCHDQGWVGTDFSLSIIGGGHDRD